MIGKILKTFAELGVLPQVVAALATKGIETAFPIQEMALPIALAGSDLIGQARTGTGKTFAFGIPLVQRTISPTDPRFADLKGKNLPQALIVAPTRELALQVSKDIELVSKDLGIRSLTVYGGVPYEQQLDALKEGVEIVIGTPGRLIDLMKRGSLVLSYVHTLVLDEADEMLDLGFLPDVETLLAKTPESRQTMLFSATMPGQIVSLARRHLRHPLNVRAESSSENQTVPATSQFVWQAHDMDKPEIVARILQATGRERVIIFTKTKRSAQRVTDDLNERGFEALPLHGDMAQPARERALAKFRKSTSQILVATDVAARGIDVDNVTHVINYTCPDDEKTYVHRIGRTGRAGASGIAITFVDWADLARWKLINKALDLPFDEPEEMYSTSERLYQEIDIPAGTKGRIAPAAKRETTKPAEKKRPAKKAETSGGKSNHSSKTASNGSSAKSSATSGTARKRQRRRKLPSE